MAVVDLEIGLSDEDIAVRDTAHKFTEEVLRPAGAELGGTLGPTIFRAGSPSRSQARRSRTSVSFPPKRSIGEVVRIIKSNSARELFREFPSLKRRLWAGELWEDGYFVRTVGDRMTRDVIKKYIQHHRDLAQGPAQLDLKLR